MNVYDFDGTIFYSDCSIGFALWCIKRHPKLWFTYLPGVIKAFVLHKMGIVPNYLLQRKMFSYLTMIDDLDTQIEKFRPLGPFSQSRRKRDVRRIDLRRAGG